MLASYLIRQILSLKKKKKKIWAVVAHTFNPSPCEAEAGGSLLFLNPPFLKMVSRTARAVTQRNPVSKKKKKKKKNQNQINALLLRDLMREY